MIRKLLPLILAGVLLVPASSSASPFADRYDWRIKTAVNTYWPDYPFWRAWKAQLFQESRLDPRAVSPVGARGLAQFMPGTWADTTRQMGAVDQAVDGEFAIDAGAYYMARLRKGWASPRPQADRHKLAQASYNAGMGHIIKAQRLCLNPSLYEEIIACLPSVTGKHSTETITYVKNIDKWWKMMELGR
jgi:membrane-bound lytic murein transglycosylase MltF